MVGELGEYANVRKKFERGELSWDEYIKAAHEELADTLIYLDILAFHAGVDLSEATIEKFNSVSDRIGESGLKLFTSTLRRGDE
jgi:NTP pyrophosphatase (non-canonical NTP hydrolase)